MKKVYKNLIVKDGLEITAEFYKDENYLIVGYYYSRDLKNKPLEDLNRFVSVLKLDMLNFETKADLLNYIENGNFINKSDIMYFNYNGWLALIKDLEEFSI